MQDGESYFWELWERDRGKLQGGSKGKQDLYLGKAVPFCQRTSADLTLGETAKGDGLPYVIAKLIFFLNKSLNYHNRFF